MGHRDDLHFEWDPAKNASNTLKHRVTFEEASTVFGDERGILLHDPLHSDDEERWILTGTSLKDRLLVVVFGDRNDTIRIISARRANRRETHVYETQ